jgi:hypothetical protein
MRINTKCHIACYDFALHSGDEMRTFILENHLYYFSFWVIVLNMFTTEKDNKKV